MDAFIKIFVCLCRASHMERKANSSQFAFLGNAVGARGTVCPRKALRARCVPVSRPVGLVPRRDEASEGACKA